MSSRVCIVLLGLLGAVLPCLTPAVAAAPVSQKPAASAAAPAPAAASGPAAASAPAVATPDPRAQLAAKFPGARVEDLHPSPIPGVYEFSQGTAIVYLSADGKYAINGDLLEVGTNNNITEQRRRSARVRVLADLSEKDMVIFAPKDPKYTVTVFTDVDCAYCRELHRQIAEYNRLGIRVRYLAYPRSGPNTESWRKAEQVWCSPDRNTALTAAKRDQPLPAKVCPNNPVASDYALGQNFDLQGTPAIVMPNGEMVQGYMTPVELAQHLVAAK